jgi:hypothetical protein
MVGWFKKRPDKADAKESLSPEVEAIFRKIDRLMSDEKTQNEQLPEPFRSEVSRGVSCDELAGATGEFGRDPRNPIPVNGPLGELIYLSNLRTTNLAPVLFHRLGSLGRVDVFETVSFDGSLWDILFLDLYHPRKSRHAPVGYQTSGNKGRAQLFFGTNEFVEVFPDQLPDAIANTFERIIGVRMRPPQVRELIERTRFSRPAAHKGTVESILQAMQRDGTPSTLQRIQKLAETTVAIIDLQLTLAEKTSDDVKNQKWPLGYCFGALDSVARHYGVDWKTDGVTLVKEGFALIMSEREGERYVRRCLTLQEDRLFAEGREHGGDDFHLWLTTKGEFKPLMLMNFFSFGKPAPRGEIR